MTISEIMISVVIISFLATLGAWAYRSQLFKGFDVRRKADIHRIKVAVEEYEKDHDYYPTKAMVTCGGSGLSPYLDRVPCDPETNTSYAYEPEDVSSPSWYQIFTNLKVASDPDIEKVGCTSGCGPYASSPDINCFNWYARSPNAPEAYKGQGCPAVGGGSSTWVYLSGSGSYNGCKLSGGNYACVPILHQEGSSPVVTECAPAYPDSIPNCGGQCTTYPVNLCQ